MTKKKILITGSSSRFCKFLKKDLVNQNVFFANKKIFNILNIKQMENFVRKNKIKYLIHIAGLSRPMALHEKKLSTSINLNIIGSANVVKVCSKFKIKLIYFSTNYVYPCKTGNYKETDTLMPINNYAWSKLGGESAVQMYKNSLILRLSMTDFPFVHKKALKGAYSSFMYNKTISKIIPYILDEKGILNIGGKKREIFNFAKKFGKKKILPIKLEKINNYPKDSSIDIKKLKKILKVNRIKIEL